MPISCRLFVWFMRGNFFQMSQIQMFAYCPLMAAYWPQLLGTKGLAMESLLFSFLWSQRVTELKIYLLTAANVSFYVDSITTNLKGFVTTQSGQKRQWILFHWQQVWLKISQTHKGTHTHIPILFRALPASAPRPKAAICAPNDTQNSQMRVKRNSSSSLAAPVSALSKQTPVVDVPEIWVLFFLCSWVCVCIPAGTPLG